MHGKSSAFPNMYIGKNENAYAITYDELQERLFLLFKDRYYRHKKVYQQLVKDYELALNVMKILVKKEAYFDDDLQRLIELKPKNNLWTAHRQRKQLLHWWNSLQTSFYNWQEYSDTITDIVAKQAFTITQDNDEQIQKTILYFKENYLPDILKQITKELKPLKQYLNIKTKFDIRYFTDDLTSKYFIINTDLL